MMNPFNNFNTFMNGFKSFMSNPSQFVMQRYGFSQDIANNPDKMIQQMMNSGRISQDQYNYARNIAQQIQQNPMFSQLMR